MNILHVDDEKDILFLTKVVLEQEPDTNVVQCESGFEALEALQEISPDVILLDLMMPGMTGEELFDEVKRSEPVAKVPVVFMTARTTQDVIDRLMSAGAAGFIAKPFKPDSLAAYLKSAVEDSRNAAQQTKH